MSGKPALGGVMVPITTPFDPVTGDVAPVPLRENARDLLDAGVTGVVATGSTGEAALLTEGEYAAVIDWLRDVVPDDRWLVAGAGRESTRATVAACRAAAEHGADAVLVRPPGYYGPSLSIGALVEHFRRVADDSPVPVLLYNIPKYTHVALQEAVLAALLGHPNVLGAKDSSGDLRNFASYRQAAPEWALFIGNGACLYAGLELGGVGGILAVANFATALSAETFTLFMDRAGAGAAQERLAPLHKGVVGERGVPGVKAALDAVGRHGGPVRAPLRDLDADDRDHIRVLLAAAGLA
jgi:4-hydroxy-2-oxoglutarate aldolase